MSSSPDSHEPVAGASAVGGIRRRWLYIMLALAVLFVVMPFFFWQCTWFGRPLTDQQIEKNLADREHPRKAQHALSQIADRITSRDATARASARRWYPQVVALAAHDLDELRLTAAWVMGQDNAVPEFRQALLRLLADRNPMVQRNAALALVRFRDASGRPVILAMLQPYTVTAPHQGTLARRLKAGDALNPGTLLGRIQAGEHKTEVRAQVPGTLERWVAPDGSEVSVGEAIALLTPSSEMVWGALRALYLIGQPEDLSHIERYARGEPGMHDSIRQQAAQTARTIRARSMQ